MKKSAFTLAEVLITLTIIGVIAALTIPNLTQKHQEQEFIQKLKKNYSVMSNAYIQAIRENGNPDSWLKLSNNSYENSKNLYTKIKPYIKVEKECSDNDKCFSSKYKALFADKSYWDNLNDNTDYYKVLLQDGTAIAIYSTGTSCYFPEKNNTYEMSCGNIIIDLNNKKGPNKFGIDTFMFTITEKNIFPSGVGYPKLLFTSGTRCTYNDTNNRNGATCGAHAIYKGNMDYLRRDISNEW